MPPRPATSAAMSLAGAAPLAARWIERVLAGLAEPLSPAQFLALRAIAAEPVGGAQLAQRAAVSGPAVSQLVAGLSDAGLVERRPHAADRRRIELHLTAAGAQALRTAEEQVGRELAALLADLPRPEVDALARALPHLEAALAGSAPPRRPPPPGPRGPRPRP